MVISNFDQNNLTSFRGDDLGIKLAFMDTDDVPIDITGWNIFFTIKRTKDDRDALAVVRVDEDAIPNPTLGEVLLVVPNTVTINLHGSNWYDIQIKKADDTIQTVTSGNIEFKKDVTQRIIPT